jgi:hypothetical protein
MTSPRNGSPTCAVVLGGGGAVGVGWQIGLLTGLREAGVDLKATADQMMDPNVAIRALQVGKRQAEREAPAIQAAWALDRLTHSRRATPNPNPRRVGSEYVGGGSI